MLKALVTVWSFVSTLAMVSLSLSTQIEEKICHILEYENPCNIFVLFFILCYFIFPLMYALVYVDIDHRHTFLRK